MTLNKQHIGLIGGGVIGLSVGWQLLRNGHRVTIFEANQAGEATSSVAAGMLAPQAEVNFGEVDLMKLGRKSLALYPEFLQELREDVEKAPQLDTCGTIMVGLDRDDAAYLKRLYEYREELDLKVEWWGGSKAREEEPLLSPRVTSAIHLPEDAQVNNLELLSALKVAFQNRGGTLYENTKVDEAREWDGKFSIQTQRGTNYSFDEVVIAAGPWSDPFMNDKATGKVYPVKGQIITLQRTSETQLNRMIRSPRMYFVPKDDGTIRLGGTSEEKGFNMDITAGGMKDLLEEGWETIPAIYDSPLTNTQVGFRPASSDHKPIIGRSQKDGMHYATGHYRHGFLLAPITAYWIADRIEGEAPDGSFDEKFGPDRFAGNS